MRLSLAVCEIRLKRLKKEEEKEKIRYREAKQNDWYLLRKPAIISGTSMLQHNNMRMCTLTEKINSRKQEQLDGECRKSGIVQE